MIGQVVGSEYRKMCVLLSWIRTGIAAGLFASTKPRTMKNLESLGSRKSREIVLATSKSGGLTFPSGTAPNDLSSLNSEGRRGAKSGPGSHAVPPRKLSAASTSQFRPCVSNTAITCTSSGPGASKSTVASRDFERINPRVRCSWHLTSCVYGLGPLRTGFAFDQYVGRALIEDWQHLLRHIDSGKAIALVVQACDHTVKPHAPGQFDENRTQRRPQFCKTN